MPERALRVPSLPAASGQFPPAVVALSALPPVMDKPARRCLRGPGGDSDLGAPASPRSEGNDLYMGIIFVEETLDPTAVEAEATQVAAELSGREG